MVSVSGKRVKGKTVFILSKVICDPRVMFERVFFWDFLAPGLVRREKIVLVMFFIGRDYFLVNVYHNSIICHGLTIYYEIEGTHHLTYIR